MKANAGNVLPDVQETFAKVGVLGVDSAGNGILTARRIEIDRKSLFDVPQQQTQMINPTLNKLFWVDRHIQNNFFKIILDFHRFLT